MIKERGGYKTGSECPKLPSLRQLTAQLRDLHEAWSHPEAGGEYVNLTYFAGDECWKVECVDTYNEGDCVAVIGREYIPGDGARFDARAAARRLLADARKAGYK